MALCTPQDGLDYLVNLRLSENEANLSTLSLTQSANEISDRITVELEKKGYIDEGNNPSSVCDDTQILLLKHLSSLELGQVIMSDRSEVIDPRYVGIQKAQQQFSTFFFRELEKGKYYPIFNPSKYTAYTGSAASIPNARPTYSSTVYSTVTLVSYLCPGWTPGSANQVSAAVCQAWINRLTIDIYALALKTGIYNLVSLTERQARNLGKVINIGVAALVLQANSFAGSKQQVSATAYEKIKSYLELRNLLYKGKLE
jgi:hypothetical protein